DRQRLAVASRHGSAGAQERHDHGARSLCRLAASDDRAAAQRRADGVPAGDLGGAAYCVRADQDLGGFAGPAVCAPPPRAHAPGGRPRRRSRRLERPDRTGKDAGAGRRKNSTVVDAPGEPAIREKLAAQFMEPIPTTPAQFRAKIDADLARWSPVIKALDLKIN